MDINDLSGLDIKTGQKKSLLQHLKNNDDIRYQEPSPSSSFEVVKNLSAFAMPSPPVPLARPPQVLSPESVSTDSSELDDFEFSQFNEFYSAGHELQRQPSMMVTDEQPALAPYVFLAPPPPQVAPADALNSLLTAPENAVLRSKMNSNEPLTEKEKKM